MRKSNITTAGLYTIILGGREEETKKSTLNSSAKISPINDSSQFQVFRNYSIYEIRAVKGEGSVPVSDAYSQHTGHLL
jgi:hypothetical protein